MSLELSKADIDEIVESQIAYCPMNAELFDRFLHEQKRLEELEDIDLNDCAGGACKL